MLRLYFYFLLISHIWLLMGCQLIDNSVNGQYTSVPAPGPIGINVNLSGCTEAPPEALPYSCDIFSESLYAQNGGYGVAQVSAQNTALNFKLTNNTCTGLSLTPAGRLTGELEKTVTQTCSLSIEANMDGFSAEKSLTISVAPSLSFSFDQENVYLQEGQGDANIDLVLSEPAPYDTYVEFDIYGDSSEFLTGISFTQKRINILKGQSRVTLSLSVPAASGVSAVVYQQLRLKTGSVNPLPAVSLNSYASTINPRSFEAVSAGYDHTCGIDDGKLFCWGRDWHGRLGNGSGTTDDQPTPMQIGTSTGWQRISAGQATTCGIDDFKLFCWGSDSRGQVGNNVGSLFGVETPVQIGLSVTWQSVSVGSTSVCAIGDSKLYCWGSDSNGQIGNGSGNTANILVPTQIESSVNWQDISVGGNFACGIESGKLFCWGKDSYGQVGNGSGNTSDVDAPEQIGTSTSWQSINIGIYHACGIDAGRLYCWGFNIGGQVGIGNGGSFSVESPTLIGSSSLWESVSVGDYHTCGVASGTLYCWGSDGDGRLGNGSGSSTSFSAPSSVGSSDLWESVSAGGKHSCGIKNALLYCWGRDQYGQVGNGQGSGSGSGTSLPTQVGTTESWKSVTAGAFHTCGIDDTKLFCWGSDASGQVGDGSGTSTVVLNPVSIGPNISWQSVSVGYSHTCGVAEGKLYCWGSDYYGQVGDGSENTSSVMLPLKIGILENWEHVVAGYSHTCGIAGGKLFCWGKDDRGQVGNGSGNIANVEAPEQIGSSMNWQSIYVGRYHTCGVSGGKLFCWGRDDYGQIGNGSGGSSDVEAPEQIGSSTLWQSVVTGTYYTCGIMNSELYCWGRDDYGQIGNGSGSSNVDSPEQIGSSQTWLSVQTGGFHTCGIDDGKLFCWGMDEEGQVGNGSGSAANVDAPVQIGSSQEWQNVNTGNYYTCGVASGKLFCWGSDSSSQLGISTSFLGTPFLIIE